MSLLTVYEESLNEGFYLITLIYPLYDEDLAELLSSFPMLRHDMRFLQG